MGEDALGSDDASNVALTSSSTSGRSLVAARDLDAGVTLFSEPALFFVPSAAAASCAHCLAPLVNSHAVRCDRCTLASYCCDSCCDADASLHSGECGRLPRSLDATSMMHARLALRLQQAERLDSEEVAASAEPLRALLYEPVRLSLSSCPSTDGGAVTVSARVSTCALPTVRSMIGQLCGRHGACARFDMARQRRVAGAMARAAAQLEPSAAGDADRQRAEADARLEALCCVQRNVFHEYSVDEHFGAVCRGASLHLGTALTLNHSCAPNVVTFHAGRRLVTRTLRSVRRGEPLTTSYLDAQALMQPAASRRAALSATHAFECTCTRCEAAERVAAELELHAARCARDGCKGLICLPPRAYRGAGDEDEDEDEDEDGEGQAAQRADLRCPACGATHEEAPLVRACREVSRVLRSDASARSGAALAELEAAARLAAPLHPRHSARTDLERAIAMALVRDASEVAATSEATETGEAAATEGAAIAEAARALALLGRALESSVTVLKATERLLPTCHPNVGVRLVCLANVSFILHARQPLGGTKDGKKDGSKDWLAIAGYAYARAEEVFDTAFGKESPAARQAATQLRMRVARLMRKREAENLKRAAPVSNAKGSAPPPEPETH